MKKMDSIVSEVLARIEPSKEEFAEINEKLGAFVEGIKKRIEKQKILAEIFVGGSVAKGTLIKKDFYDVDVFLRFDKKYPDAELSEIAARILEGVQNCERVHGSRDYFRVRVAKNIFIELIPVQKVKKPEESGNITDLSYSHVKYINKKLSGQMRKEIMLAKAFCFANQCYGAESYIHGFSGYAIELLIYHYKSFSRFLKGMVKIKEKEVIDIEKHYKNKQRVLMDLNGAKLESPIVLIDPTYKSRNALAALSGETFEKFQKVCREFLKNPSIKFFEIQKTDLAKIESDAKKKGQEFILLEAKTEKQEGDIAGSKLLKFYNNLSEEISRFFAIKKKGFNYNGKKSARFFFVATPLKEILVEGPSIKDSRNVKRFEKAHPDYFTKKGRIYAKERITFGIREFMGKWTKKNSRKIKEMYVEALVII